MRQQGFSLLELSIVLTIIAIVLASGLTLSEAKIEQAQFDLTREEMKEIDKNFSIFVRANSRLPCPARITLPRNDPEFGREPADCADATPPAGVIRVEHPGGSGNFVRIGGLPFYSLGLPDRYLDDAWGGRYLYAVSENMITTVTPASNGNITVIDGTSTGVSDEVAWVLTSLGPSREGAYSSRSGGLIFPCDTGNLDGENCDNDGVFRDAPYNDGDYAATFYDDLILWETRMRLYNVGVF